MPLDFDNRNPHNIFDRLSRNLGHHKGSRIKNVNYAPLKGDGQDGDMQMKDGNLYIKNNNIWYHFVPSGALGVVDNISQLTDNTTGTVSDTLDDNTPNQRDDIASLAAKINKIIELLRLDVTS